MKKNVIRITAVFLAIVTVLLIVFISSCNNRSKKTDEDIKDATFDEIVESVRDDAIENSDNVNGARFNSTLLDFTLRYNEAKKSRGENTDLIMEGKWKKNGDESSDDNGVKIQYYYYDEENTNFTATVEVESQKLLNIGFGTTMSYYMGHRRFVITKMTAPMCSKRCSVRPPPTRTERCGSSSASISLTLSRIKRTAKTISCCSEYSRYPTA